MRVRIPILTLVLLVVPTVAPSPTVMTAKADTIYVCWDGSGDFLTIQEGINAASDGDEVIVCDGTYTGDNNRDLDFRGKAITLRSADGPESCIIDCQTIPGEPHCGFYFHSDENADSVVDGFTITNGYGVGGAIFCLSSSPTVSNCIILGYGGSGICCIWASPTIKDCFIAGNAAGAGGGIYCIHASLTVTNCVITGNGALGSIPPEIGGGGIYCSGLGDPIITNCTIANNWSFSSAAGGVFCQECHTGPTLTNCILSGNSDADGSDESAQIDGYDSEIALDYCCVQGWSGDLGGVGNIGDDPRFVDADGPDGYAGTQDDNLRFLPCSPCIDAGSNHAVPPGITTDLDGNPRFVDEPYMPDSGSGTPPIVDMGAYEFQADCRGDLNGDRVVDHADLGILLAAWHSTAAGDLDCDGYTGHHDLGLLLTHWGEECP